MLHETKTYFYAVIFIQTPFKLEIRYINVRFPLTIALRGSRGSLAVMTVRNLDVNLHFLTKITQKQVKAA
jgi:hypothetical protein